MLVQDGAWNGEQLVDVDWLRESTQIQSGTEAPYGYYFWIMPAIEGYMMIGHGGQFLYVCESKQLIISYTAFPYINDLFFGDSGKLAELIYRSAQ